jgi:CheY-like chemotaxis protein
VLLNLVVNARDAMPDGGTLTISAENCIQPPSTAPGAAALGPAVLVRVSDTGMGIPEEVREKIFEPFFTTKEFGQGTGLGLSTVMAIVKSHGGSIHLETTRGEGTSFTIAFPAVPQMVEDTGSEEKSALGNEELLLLIDDEASVRLVVKQMLEASGYRVITAPDGATALSLYAERRSDISLVITDMMMPGMDGAATIRALKNLDPDVLVIAASGMMHEERRRARQRLARWLSCGSLTLPIPFSARSTRRSIAAVNPPLYSSCKVAGLQARRITCRKPPFRPAHRL